MTTLTSEYIPDTDTDHTSGLSRARYRFRHWRWGRPFWGALFVAFGGAEIMYIPYSPIGVVLHEGIAGIGGMFIGALLIMFAASALFAPSYRVFAGIASVLLSLAALPATNFGGFLIGTLCALFGGSFVVAWAPRAGMTAVTRTQLRKQRKQAALADVDTDAGADAGLDTDAARTAEDGSVAYEEPIPDGEPTGSAGFTESEIAAAELAATTPERTVATVPEPDAAPFHTATDPED